MRQPVSPPLDLHAAENALQVIRALDLRCVDIDSILEFLVPLFRGHRVSAPRFQPGLVLYRACACEKPTRLSELLYPPGNKTVLGRANPPGQPMFYCCTSREAPFFELRPEPNSTVVVTRWRTTAPLVVNHVGYTAKNFSRLATKRVSAGWSATPTDHPGGRAQQLIAEYLAEIFCAEIPPERQYEYKLSCAVAHKLCASDLFGGLIYPTIQMNANADNFALKPSYVDKHLKFEKVEFVRINKVLDRLKLEVTVLDTAIEITKSNAILWRGRRDQWQLRSKGDMLVFSVENGKWVARNSEGTIIEPT